MPTLVSVMSGPSGEVRDGRYFIATPRTRFRVPGDKAVVVHFEWLGTPGTYTLSGTWRGPGGVSTTSEFEYTARDRRLSAYWELPLGPSVPLGDWTLEARVGGQPAGTHEFQILGMDADPAPAAAPRRIPLERRDVFARALSATGRIEAFDASGARLATGPVVLLGDDLVATSFSLVNNAVRVRIRGASGDPVDVADVAAFNRREDWALFRVTGVVAPADIARAPASAQAGDPCFSVSASSDGALSVSAGEVTGASEHPVAGRRLLVSFFANAGSPGAPVIDEYGDIVGMVAAGMLPGVPDADVMRPTDLAALRTSVVPVSQVSGPSGEGRPLGELAATPYYTPPVTMQRQVQGGGFAAALARDDAGSFPINYRSEFSQQDAVVAVFVNWRAVEPFKGAAVLRVYDIDNGLLAEAKPMKLSLRKGDIRNSYWQFSRPDAGTYRADVLLGSAIAWRGYFQVVE